MNRRKILLFLVIASIFFFHTSFAINSYTETQDGIYSNSDKNIKFEEIYPAIPEGYEEIAHTPGLKLYFNSEANAIAVQDLRNNYLWKSIVDEELYDLESANEHWKSYMTSMFRFEYTGIQKETSLREALLAHEAKKVEMRKTTNGISLDYYFTDLEISIGLDILLEDNALIVKIPEDRIKETGIYGVVSIELLPFMGAANSSIDGYIFYPDGSGALMRYENKLNRQRNDLTYTWNVYGLDEVDLEEYKDNERKKKYQAMLPLFGVKNGDNAFICIASKNESDGNINLSPEGNVVDLNRISFSFTYRHFFEILLSNITVNGMNLAQNLTSTKVDSEIIEHDHEIRYMFLAGKEANYSGMANLYRNYLIENNKLNKYIQNNSEIPLGLDIFMGIKEERILFDKFVVMTSFDEAKVISESLISKGVNEMQIKLLGWTKGGYGLYPVNWPPEKKFGGKEGLKEFLDFTIENNIETYVQTNFMNAKDGNDYFSKRYDVVMDGMQLPVTSKRKNSYLLNPRAAYSRMSDFLKNFSRVINGGVAFEKLGNIIYHDYNEKNPSDRVDTAEQWEKMLETASRHTSHIAVEGGNQYVLRYARRLFNIPDTTSDYYINDESIPFYQMIVHGMIPYTSEAGNLSYDHLKQKLKWVEYGCMPYYELTYKKSQELKFTEYNKLFSSYYADWIDIAADVYKEFNKKLGDLWSENMTEHERVDKELYKVSYSNGTTIYINYNSYDLKYDGFLIKALDYLVVDREGNMK